MPSLATTLDSVLGLGQLVWLRQPSAQQGGQTADQTALIIDDARTTLPKASGVSIRGCDTFEEFLTAIDSQTAMLLLPAVALTPAHLQTLCDTLHKVIARADLPVVIIADTLQNTSGQQTRLDMNLLAEVCAPLLLPDSALAMSLPGLMGMACRAFEALRIGVSQVAADIRSDSSSKAMREIVQRDQLFQSLLKVLPVGIAIAHDVECTQMTMNPAAAQLLDIPLSINPSKTGPDQNQLDFTCLINGKVAADDDLPMQVAARTGKAVMGQEIQIIRGDRTKLTIAFYAVPMFNAQGQTTGCAGVLVDITSLKKSEMALLKSETRLNLAQKCANAGIWEWNHQTGEIIWSDELRQLFGLPLDFDPSLENWHTTIHPDDLDEVVSTLSHHEEFQMEYRIQRPDGALQWVLTSGQLVVDENDKPLRMLGICMDITDHKLAEQALRENAERFRTMMDVSPLGVFITDVQGNYQYTNAVLQRISHMSESSLIEHGLLSLVHPDEMADVQAAWREVLVKHERFEQVCRLLLPGNQHAWIHLRAAPVIHDGELNGYIGKVEDITHQRQSQAELKRSQDRLQKTNATLAPRSEDMEELLSITAHDLKHPVVGIQGLLSLLKEDCYDKLNADNKLNLDLSLGECERMKEMLTRLSELGRIEQTRPRMGLASLRDVVDTCVKRFQSLCQQLDITLKIDVPEKQIRMPKAILEEVLSNLIDNAIKYGCSNGSGVIVITASCEDETCSITVKDNGPGIDPQHHERIFRPFRRLVAKNGQTGSGLGLTAVKRLIQRIGGQVRVVSAPSQGASFEMKFPIENEKPCEDACE